MFRTNYNNNRKAQQLPMIAQIGIGIILLLVAFKGYRMFKAANLTGKAVVNDITKSTQINEVKQALNQSGITDVRSAKVEEASDDIYAALFTDSWYGEDEQKVIDTLNSLQSIGECKAVARIYKTNTKKVLISDVKKYLSTSDLSKIKQSYLKAISI